MLEKAPLAVDSVVEEVVKRLEGKKKQLKNHEIEGIQLAEDRSGTEIVDGYAAAATREEGTVRTADGRSASNPDASNRE